MLKSELKILIASNGNLFDEIEEFAIEGMLFIDFNNFENYWANKKIKILLDVNDDNTNQSEKILHQEDIVSLKKIFSKPIKKTVCKCKLRFVHNDGRYVESETKIYYISNKNNSVERLLILVSSIKKSDDKSNLNEILANLNEEKLRFKLALESTGDGLWDWDIENNKIFYSSQWKKMLGYEDSEISNNITEWEKRVHPEDLKRCIRDIENYLNGQSNLYYNEHRLLHKNGAYIWVLDRGKIKEYDKNGKPKRFIGVKTEITANKKSELELLNTKQILSSLISNIPGVSYRCLPDDSWTLVFISKEIKHLSGYEHTDFIYNKVRSYSSIIHPDDIEITSSILKGISETSNNFEIEYRIIDVNREVKWVSEKGCCIFNNKGEIQFIDGIIFDISEQKKINDDLKRTRKLLLQAGKLARLGWWEYDIINDKVLWSEITREIHGVDNDYEPIYEEVLNFYKEGKDKENIINHINNAIEYGKPWECELQIQTVARKDKWVSVIGNTEVVDGKCIRLYGSFQDIDEIKKKNIKLENFEILQKLTNSVPGIVYQFEQFKDMTYQYTFLSDNVANVHKDLTRELIFKNPELPFSLLHPDDIKSFIDSMRYAYRNFEEWKHEYRVVCKDGSIIWHQGHSKPEKQENGNTVWYGYIHNITEAKELQFKLQEKVDEVVQKNNELERYISKNKELERFAYIVSHDLKEPLRTIKAFSEIIKSKYMTTLDENANTYFNFIISSSERMTNLIEGILDYSKIEESDYPFETVDINDLLNNLIFDLNSSISESNAEIIYENLDAIYCNQIQIRQLFQNILSNAIKFSAQNGKPKVEIKSIIKENHIIYTISDNGIGIKKEYFNTIFAMFKKLHTREEYRGHGVGLALCKRIVEKHNGEIWVESDGTNGTTFFISFPKH